MTNPVPGDYSRLEQWFSVMRQLAGVSRTGGTAKLTIAVWVDEYGKPLFWERPTVTEILPKIADVGVLTTE